LCEPGLARKEIREQSSCYVFLDGKVMTYNDEIFCKVKSPLKDSLSGAVQGRRLLGLLRKMPDDEVEVYSNKKYVMVEGKNKGAGVRWEKEVLLPVNKIEQPDKWTKLHPNFKEALTIVSECAGKKQENFAIICVHLVPEYIEAFDNHQAARYKLETGVRESVLCKRDSIKCVVDFDMTKFCETDNWMYFKNGSGYTFACRRWLEPYPDIAKGFKLGEGRKINLPKALKEAAEQASDFAKENEDDQDIKIEIRSGKIRVTGTGQHGFYYEKKQIRYEGPPLKFYISPALLVALAEKYPECTIGTNKLLVKGERFRYVASLTPEEENE